MAPAAKRRRLNKKTRLSIEEAENLMLQSLDATVANEPEWLKDRVLDASDEESTIRLTPEAPSFSLITNQAEFEFDQQDPFPRRTPEAPTYSLVTDHIEFLFDQQDQFKRATPEFTSDSSLTDLAELEQDLAELVRDQSEVAIDRNSVRAPSDKEDVLESSENSLETSDIEPCGVESPLPVSSHGESGQYEDETHTDRINGTEVGTNALVKAAEESSIQSTRMPGKEEEPRVASYTGVLVDIRGDPVEDQREKEEFEAANPQDFDLYEMLGGGLGCSCNGQCLSENWVAIKCNVEGVIGWHYCREFVCGERYVMKRVR